MLRALFSLTGLIASGVLLLLLASLFLLFRLLPYLSPLFHLLSTVILPLFLGMVVAYLLHPIVTFLTRFKVKRSVAILGVYLLFFGGLAGAAWVLYPLLADQIREMVERLPEYTEKLRRWYWAMDHHVEHLPRGLHSAIDQFIDGLQERVSGWISRLMATFSSLAGHALLFLVVPFFAFYFLNDMEKIMAFILRLIPRPKRKLVVRLFKEIDRHLGEYVRGQLLVSGAVSFLASLGYYLIGLPYPLLLGLMMGILNIIPYFGPLIGTVISTGFALVSEPRLIVWIVLINLFIQLVEGNLLNPYIVGKRLHIHPMVIMIVLLVGAEVGGLFGLLFAVPFFVIFKVLVVNTFLYVYRHAFIDKL